MVTVQSLSFQFELYSRIKLYGLHHIEYINLPKLLYNEMIIYALSISNNYYSQAQINALNQVLEGGITNINPCKKC